MSQKDNKLSLSTALPTSRKRHRENRSENTNSDNNRQQQQQHRHTNRGNRQLTRGRGRGRRRGDRQRYGNFNNPRKYDDRNLPHHNHYQENQRSNQETFTQPIMSSTSIIHENNNIISNYSGPQRSVEGWVIIVTGVHEEAQEEDIQDTFSEYGQINNIRVNLDTLTGFCKGYTLIEYSEKSEAQDAINALHGKEFLGKSIHVDWAFVGGGSADDSGIIRPNKKVKNGAR